MGNMVGLEVLVDKSLANELMNKGVAEVAFRQADAKFREIVKCKVLGANVKSEIVPQKVVSAAMNLNAQNVASMDKVKGMLYSVQKGTKSLSTTTKNIATQVDGLYQLTNSLMNISYLNTGLSLANTAVDVAGFALITEKLNLLNSDVQAVANQLMKVANVQKNEKIADCQKLIMRCNKMAAKIRDDDKVNLDEFEYLLMDIRAFISEMILNLHDESLEESLILEMVFTLMPAYTSLFNEFIRRYYFTKKSVPANYTIFLSLYGELESDSYVEHLEDYYFLEEKLHASDVVNVLTAQTLIGLNGRVQIEDQLDILTALETEEKAKLFEEGMARYANQLLRESIPLIAKECEMSQETCEKYFFV